MKSKKNNEDLKEEHKLNIETVDEEIDKSELKLEKKNEIKILKKRKRLIETYESDVKKYRDYYINSLEKIDHKNKNKKKIDNEDEVSDEDVIDNDILFSISKSTIGKTFISIFGIAIVFVFDFNVFSIVFDIVFFTLSSYAFCYFNRKDNQLFLDEYKKKLHSLGYLTIDEYEDDLEEFLTGPEGLFHEELVKLIHEYDIDTEHIDFAYSQSGNKNYIWSNNDFLYMLDTDLYSRPQVVKIPISNILYYRVDYTNHLLVIKTYNEEFYFEESSIVIFSKYLKGKEYSINNLIDPDTALSDYRAFMYGIKNVLESGDDVKFYKANKSDKKLYNISLCLILFSILRFIPINYSIYTNFCELGIIVFLISFCSCLFDIYCVNFLLKRSTDDILEDMANNVKCINKFNELKMSLGIDESSCDTIYNVSDQPFLIWKKGKYIHIFFNVVYYDSLYLSFKNSDVDRYYIDEEGCKLFIRDTGIVFKLECKEILDKYLVIK